MTDLRPRRSNPLLTRRSFLRYGGSAGAALAGISSAGLWRTALAVAGSVRRPDSLPDPKRPAGTVTEALPFDHIVVVMMENHSFDNLLGALRCSGQPNAHGLKFNPAAKPSTATRARAARCARSRCRRPPRRPSVTQTWNATHTQIDGGKMDGFVALGRTRRADGLLDRGRAPVRVLVRAHVHAGQPVVLLGARVRPTPTAAS